MKNSVETTLASKSTRETNTLMSNSRRSFLKRLLGIGIIGFIASVFYPLFEYLKPPRQREVEVNSVSAGKINDFLPDSGKIIRFGDKPVLVIRTKSGVFKAFSANCTHLDCTVQYKSEMGLIWCACHNGKFDLTGRNISGPPPRPLEEFNTIVKNEELIITKKV